MKADCSTAALRCGQTLRGHTRGGARGFDGGNYERWYCAPGVKQYTGPERVYRLDLPAQTTADIRLESPCADLDLFAMVWTDDSRCPSSHPINNCEADVHRGGGQVHIENVKNALGWLVVVEGKAGELAPFELSVACEPRKF